MPSNNILTGLKLSTNRTKAPIIRPIAIRIKPNGLVAAIVSIVVKNPTKAGSAVSVTNVTTAVPKAAKPLIIP